jgi:hypothetical protein
MKEIGKTDLDMDKVSSNTEMGVFMKDHGREA